MTNRMKSPDTILSIRISGLNVTLLTFQNLSVKISKTSYIDLLFKDKERIYFKKQIEKISPECFGMGMKLIISNESK